MIMRKIILLLGLIGVAIVFVFVWEMIAFDKDKKMSLVCRDYSFNSWAKTQTTDMCNGITKFNKNLRSKFLGVKY